MISMSKHLCSIVKNQFALVLNGETQKYPQYLKYFKNVYFRNYSIDLQKNYSDQCCILFSQSRTISNLSI